MPSPPTYSRLFRTCRTLTTRMDIVVVSLRDVEFVGVAESGRHRFTRLASVLGNAGHLQLGE